jgi:H+/Cl- antiporter ClcA
MIFMIVLSIISAISSVLIDLMTLRLVQARGRMSDLGHNFWTKYIIWVSYGVAFAILSASCVRYISPFIVGSGMADMKTIMSGIVMPKVLDLRTGIGKFLGIATTMSAG